MRPVLFALLIGALAAPCVASAPSADGPTRGKAFLLSLAVPGLGHHYANAGDWDGAASLFLAAEAGLWVGLVSTILRHDRITDGYQSLAALRADADISGKDRRFFLTIGSYRSSDEYLEVQLRNRAWDQIDYVQSRAYHWEWQSEEDFQRFRSMRDDAETLRRRRPMIAAMLVGNRLLSGLLAIRQAGRADDRLSMSFTTVPDAPERPAVRISARF